MIMTDDIVKDIRARAKAAEGHLKLALHAVKAQNYHAADVATVSAQGFLRSLYRWAKAADDND